MKIVLPEPLKELQPLPNWVAWKLATIDGKPKKIPLNPRTGKNASSTNPDTWTDFDTAAAFAERKGYTDNRTGGIGFMFGTEPCRYAGIDIDDCIAPDGTLSKMAKDIVFIMGSYTEISPSGTGLHILFKLNKPLTEIGKGNKKDAIGLEIYDNRRYLTITGNVYGETWPIAERTEKIQEIYTMFMSEPEKDKPKTASTTTTVDTYVENKNTAMKPQGTPNGNTENLSDSELWERMFASEHGRKIRALYNGDISGYTRTDKDGNVHDDYSAADLAMCSILIWWTHGDTGRVDRMFRQSGLIRPKWDERHGAQTYGDMTIAKAMNNTYEPQEKSGHVHNTAPAVMTNSTVSTELSTVGGGVLAPSVDTSQTLDSNMPVTTDWTPPITGFEYVDTLLFKADLERFRKFPIIKSGLDNFDEKQGGFVPGLIILGATPSAGKTTFLSQIADNIAGQGNPVLFFSLEQSRLEMTSKSISRLTAQLDKRNAVSSINIRRGNFVNDTQRKLFDKAVAKYQEFSRNISIIECGFGVTISAIVETIERFIEHTGLRPCVIIDYAQVIKPDKQKLTGKDAVDFVIGELKKVQVSNNLVMFVVSSFNRTNYLMPVDYESFKESGGIEYTADILLGMQPQVLTSELFDKEKAVKAKRDAVDKALSTNPRKVMLKNLKNRYGPKGYSCGFDYYCMFDLFMPDKTFKENDNDKTAIL